MWRCGMKYAVLETNQGSSHPFSINTCMQGELTLRLSSTWMYIAYTSLLFDCPHPFVEEFTKREKNLVSLYMHA